MKNDVFPDGEKRTTDKTDWSNIPIEVLDQVAQIFNDGAQPASTTGGYGGPRSWMPGIKYSKLHFAIMRHIIKWFYFGEDYDGSGKHHLAHIIANCMMLLTYIDNNEFDDRREHAKKAKIGKLEKN